MVAVGGLTLWAARSAAVISHSRFLRPTLRFPNVMAIVTIADTQGACGEPMRKKARQNPRRKFTAEGMIYQDGKPFVRCKLSDVSHNGAKLEFDKNIELPSKFVLSLTPDGSVRRDCTLIWRLSNSVGVQFERPDDKTELRSPGNCLLPGEKAPAGDGPVAPPSELPPSHRETQFPLSFIGRLKSLGFGKNRNDS